MMENLLCERVKRQVIDITKDITQNIPHRCVCSINMLIIYNLSCSILVFSLFFLFIELIGVTLVDKIRQASGSQFYNISVPCIYCVFTHPKPSSCTIYPFNTVLYFFYPLIF